MKKRQQRTVGAIVKIPLQNGTFTYGRILENHFAFYEVQTQKNLALEEVIQKPVLFFATVYDRAVTAGFWQKVGKITPLEPHLLKIPPRFIQDFLNPDHYEIVDENGIRSATKAECDGLEPWIVYTHEDIEARLSEYYVNRSKKYDIAHVFSGVV